jgi:hypothetical protein
LNIIKMWFSIVLLSLVNLAVSNSQQDCNRQIVNNFCLRFDKRLIYICRSTVVLFSDGTTVCDKDRRCATLELPCLNSLPIGTRVSRFPDVTTTATLNVTLSSTPGVSFMEAVNASNVLKIFKFLKSDLPETETPAETETTATTENQTEDPIFSVSPERDTFISVQTVDTEKPGWTTAFEEELTTTTTATTENQAEDPGIFSVPPERDTFSSVQTVPGETETTTGRVRLG